MGVGYLVGNLNSINYFLSHDPSGLHAKAIDFYLQDFRSACTRTLFENEKTVVDEITCN